MSRKTVQALPCLLTGPVMVSSFLAMMAISRWLIVASAADCTKTPCFLSCNDLVEKHPIFVRTTDQVTANAQAIVTLVLSQDVWNTVLGNTRHVQVIRQNFVTSTMDNHCCCCDFIYHLGAIGMQQRRNFLDPEFSSDHSWPTGMLIISPVQNVCAT
jgi:hypothetical protein